VEVVAKGQSPNIEQFAQWLEIGPSFARVESVKSSPITLTEDVKEFTIRR
jgi:acylphosphatase